MVATQWRFATGLNIYLLYNQRIVVSLQYVNVLVIDNATPYESNE